MADDIAPPHNPYNPISQWKEHVELPGLTLFDIHRKPREVIVSDKQAATGDENIVSGENSTLMKLPLKKLNSEFHCPICLEYMKKTQIVMECLHRFCGNCIEKCLRLGKKECPSCRIHIPSRRSLRPDTNFDNLLASIYGDINKLEQMEEKQIELVNKRKYMNNAYAESRARGIMQQATRRGNKKPNLGRFGNQPQPKPSSEGDASESQLVNFVLRRHPQERLVCRLRREYLRTSSDITMLSLKKFLKIKLSYEGDVSDFQVLIPLGEEKNGVILDDDYSIGYVHNEMNNTDHDIVLHYRILHKQKQTT